jgi:hypothetical protein
MLDICLIFDEDFGGHKKGRFREIRLASHSSSAAFFNRSSRKRRVGVTLL